MVLNILHGANYVILTGIFKHCLANEFPSYSKANILMYKKILVTSLACKYSSACCRDTKPNRALRVNQLYGNIPFIFVCLKSLLAASFVWSYIKISGPPLCEFITLIKFSILFLFLTLFVVFLAMFPPTRQFTCPADLPLSAS